MKTGDIIRAILALHRAASALRCGDLDIPSQMALGSQCSESAFTLKYALELQFPEIKIEKSEEPLRRSTHIHTGGATQ